MKRFDQLRICGSGFSRLNFMHLGVGIVGASGFFERPLGAVMM